MTRKRGCPFLMSIVAALKDKIKQFYEEINESWMELFGQYL